MSTQFQYDLGFLGGGQLARMSIQAAQRMGLKCFSLDPGEDTPASQIADAIVGRLDDAEAIAKVFSAARRVTLENEFIPADAIRKAFEISGRESTCLVPGVEPLAIIQDKLRQRQCFAASGVASPKAVALQTGEEVHEIGFPCVLKARFGGYDGKGTRYARTAEEFESHRPLWSAGGWLAEEFVPFKRELAVMVFVGTDGKRGCFPTVETVQTNHVCDLVFPCDAGGSATAIAAVEAIQGVGLFGVELFELEDGRILVNEMAPRPHNTGHYTLDWGGPSQFDQHVRLVMELPLAIAESDSFAVMANLLGQPGANSLSAATLAGLEVEGSRIHWYGKAEAKTGRKMGHLNVVGRAGESVDDVRAKAVAAREAFYAGWTRP